MMLGVGIFLFFFIREVKTYFPFYTWAETQVWPYGSQWSIWGGM